MAADAPAAVPLDAARPRLSIVIPLFNEEQIVPELIQRVDKSCRETGETYEIVVVNDGSGDQTLARLVALSDAVPGLRVIDLFRNFGHMPALSAGLARSRGAAVVVMDGDLQDPPELIEEFVARWRKGAEVVYGVRTARGEPLLRRAAIGAFHRLMGRIVETPVPRQAGTFGLMDRRVVDILNALPERSRYFAGLRAWVGGRQEFVPYARPDRSGKSRVGLGGLVRLARVALVSFSKMPLRYATLLSLASGLTLFVVGMSAIVVRLFTNLAIPGWATSTALIGLMGFVQSLVLAVISEYIAVIFDEIKARPLFVVRQEWAGGRPVGEEEQRR